MLKRFWLVLTLSGWMTALGLPLHAADGPKHLYLSMIEQYPAPMLQGLTGREFKFLVDPARLPGDPGEAFRALWQRIEAASARAGFSVAPLPGKKGAKPFKVEHAIKEYLDTPGQDLWRRGYLLRVTTKAKKGEDNRTITVKAIHEDPLRTLATPLVLVGAGATPEAEGNVGLGGNGQLREYVEKGTSWQVRREQLGSMKLADVGKFMPELMQLGLPGETQLLAIRVHAVSAKPGRLVFPGVEPFPVAMEGWSRTEGGAIFLFDFSYRSEGDYYRNAPAHQAAERFMTTVLHGDLKDLALPASGRWGGSKVRALLNRPQAN